MVPGTFFRLPTCKGTEMIDVNDIVRIEAASNYSKLFFTNGRTLVVAKLLQWFEASLNSCTFQQELRFVRIHRTHLVNKNFIHQYIKGGQGKVQLVNGEQIAVSKRRKQFFLQHFPAAA